MQRMTDQLLRVQARGIWDMGRALPGRMSLKNRDWMLEQLEGTGITMIGHYRGLLTFVEFRCEEGHTFKESPGLVANFESCPLCPPRGEQRNAAEDSGRIRQLIRAERDGRAARGQ